MSREGRETGNWVIDTGLTPLHHTSLLGGLGREEICDLDSEHRVCLPWHALCSTYWRCESSYTSVDGTDTLADSTFRTWPLRRVHSTWYSASSGAYNAAQQNRDSQNQRGTDFLQKLGVGHEAQYTLYKTAYKIHTLYKTYRLYKSAYRSQDS